MDAKRYTRTPAPRAARARPAPQRDAASVSDAVSGHEPAPECESAFERTSVSERRFAAALAQAAAIVNSTLSVEEVLDRILEQVARVVPGDLHNILLLEGETGRIVRWRGYEALGITREELVGRSRAISGYRTFRTMMETGEPVVVGDTMAAEDWVHTSSQNDHRAYVGAPIRIQGKTEGFVNVTSACPHQYGVRDGLRLRAFADHAAIALRNARLFEAKSRYADELEARVQRRTQELQARTAWSEAILRVTSDGIVVTTPSGEIIQMNPVATSWLRGGLPPSEAQSLSQAIAWVALHATEGPETFVELTGLDLELRGAPVDNTDHGAPVVVTIHDVSHLRALDRMRSRFISDVSHELRTPIAAIRLYASLIRNNRSEQRAAYFASLDEAIGRLSRLVEGILQVARLEAGQLELEPQRVNLNLLASTAVAGHAPAADAKGLSLSCELPDEPVIVYGDPHWFIQVIDNLVENALVYTPAGDICIAVGSQNHGDRDWAWLAVADTGIGIAPDEVPRVFERFYRGERARSRQASGSGLGLTIAKAIVDLHSGSIEVESEPGKGSRFTVRLPLAAPTPTLHERCV